MEWNNEELLKILKNGGVAVMPTDTIYGIVGQAENVATVHRIYNLKKRTPEKPCIILISDIAQLENFSIKLSEEQKNKLKEYNNKLADELKAKEDIINNISNEF